MTLTERTTVTTFSSLGLRPELLDALRALNLEAPTPIQAAGIPPALAGRDLVLQAETGSGKTFAYGLPLLQPLEGRVKTVRGLVIVPTRELAEQVAGEITRVAEPQGVRAIAIVGGKDLDEQLKALRDGAAVVVGTPGRLRDVLSRGMVSLKRVRTVVLDEADELLDRGFAKDLEFLLQAAPAERQTILASATMPPAVERLITRWLKAPERIAVNPGTPAEAIRHFWVQAHPRHKIKKLVQVLVNQDPAQAIVFVAKREETEHVARWLRREGFTADWIHGEMAQPHRQQVMDRFRMGEFQVLVATDLAARGIDVPGVSHVINFDVPMNPEIYVHRVGRTGRAGESGVAITLVGSDERFHFSKIRAGFPVKELKGRVEKAPGSEKRHRGPAPGTSASSKPAFETPALEKPFKAFEKPARGAKARGKRPAFDLDLPPGWVLDDAPEKPFKPAKKDGRPPKAFPKKGPSLDWDEDRPQPRRGRKPPKR